VQPAAVWIFLLRGDRKFLRLIAGEAASFKIERASLDFSTCRFSSIYAYCVLKRNARCGKREWRAFDLSHMRTNIQMLLTSQKLADKDPESVKNSL
jgi:hypothetical protein